MSGLFLYRFLGWGVSDAVGVFGCGVRRNWSQRQTKFGRKSHFLSASEPRGANLDAGVDKIRQNSPFFVYFVVRSGWI